MCRHLAKHNSVLYEKVEEIASVGDASTSLKESKAVGERVTDHQLVKRVESFPRQPRKRFKTSLIHQEKKRRKLSVCRHTGRNKTPSCSSTSGVSAFSFTYSLLYTNSSHAFFR